MTFNELIEFAKTQECSDVHITVGTALATRKFGVLQMLDPVPTAAESEAMIKECLSEKDLAKIEAGEDLDFAMITPTGTRLRANIYHQRNNLAATYRILRSDIPTFDELMVPDAVRKLILEPRGLVLITGPTGSGKTTTLASMIDYVNKKMAKHVITIEDPIEYVYYHAKSMIHQREVGRDVSSFAKALRSSLREDPDIILVGEMRDYETISIAVTAAETGHLVFSTLHTIGAASTIDRVIDVFPPHQQQQIRTQLSMVLTAVISQQLLPTADGKGRVAAFEVMIANPAIRSLIRDGKTHQIQATVQTSRAQGMITMDDALFDLYQGGVITRDMALTYAQEIDVLRKKLG